MNQYKSVCGRFNTGGPGIDSEVSNCERSRCSINGAGIEMREFLDNLKLGKLDHFPLKLDFCITF